MKTNSLPLPRLLLAALPLLLLLGACAGTSSPTPSSGTPVNPFTNPGGADTATAASTGAQPRRF